MLRRAVTAGLTALGAVLVAQASWSLLLLAAARRVRATDRRSVDERLRFRVLIPAHDEEATLPATLESLAELDYPRDCSEIVVLADHCSDDTSGVARRAGARAAERTVGRPGKGATLAWALARESSGVDAVVILDADCTVSPNLLTAAEQRLLAGQEVLQADYVVANPEASPTVRLRWVALRLINTVRPAGRDALGLSCGLNGTGMVFAARVLSAVGWPTESLVEDREEHLLLVERGIRTRFAGEITVASDLPTTAAASHSQHQRWESGRWSLWRAWVPRLARRAIGHRDPAAAGALIDLLTLPQAVVVTAGAATAAGGLVLSAAGPAALGTAALAGQAAFVLGGLRAVDAPPEAYRSLLVAPGLVLRKLRVLVEVAVGAAPRTFVRTPREQESATRRAGGA